MDRPCLQLILLIQTGVNFSRGPKLNYEVRTRKSPKLDLSWHKIRHIRGVQSTLKQSPCDGRSPGHTMLEPGTIKSGPRRAMPRARPTQLHTLNYAPPQKLSGFKTHSSIFRGAFLRFGTNSKWSLYFACDTLVWETPPKLIFYFKIKSYHEHSKNKTPVLGNAIPV